jgi:hypothetical protein
MREKIIDWCSIHRKTIGYTVAGLNILSGLSLLSSGQNTNGWLQLFLGSVIAIDTATTP